MLLNLEQPFFLWLSSLCFVKGAGVVGEQPSLWLSWRSRVSSLGAGFALGQNTPGGLCPGPPSGGVPEALCTAPGAHPMPSRLRPCPVSPAPALVGPAEKLLAVAQPPAPGTPVLKGSADLLSQGRAFREAVSY